MIIGILLIIVGIIIFFWFSSNIQKSRVDKPLIFHNSTFTIFGTLLYVLMILAGIVYY